MHMAKEVDEILMAACRLRFGKRKREARREMMSGKRWRESRENRARSE